MIEKKMVDDFIEPYYRDKDIMHNMWHIELVRRQAEKIIALGNYEVNRDVLDLALAFHRFIYREEKIRAFLSDHGVNGKDTDAIIQAAWESQRPEMPESLEGKILHDAHVLEGGKTYTVVKTLITGSVRGQSLEETLAFMQKNVLGANKCYLPETIKMCNEMNEYTESFYRELVEGIR